MALGTSFSRLQNLPTKFNHLKFSIKRHFNTTQHRINVDNCEKKLVESRSIPHAICCTAYYVMKNSIKADAFTGLIYMQSLSGIPVGNSCHSKKTFQKLRVCFTEEIMKSVRTFCERTTCVSIVADKVSIRGNTFELVGLIAIIPQAEDGKLIQALVIGSPIVL